MCDSPFETVAIQVPSSDIADAAAASDRFNPSQARFYDEHPPLARAFPHHNPRNQAILRSLDVSCEACAAPLPLQRLHGVINDYPNCTEVRYVGTCLGCDGVVENVLRVTVDQMTFLRAGEWCTIVRRPWWHAFWPWPIDRDREW